MAALGVCRELISHSEYMHLCHAVLHCQHKAIDVMGQCDVLWAVETPKISLNCILTEDHTVTHVE